MADRRNGSYTWTTWITGLLAGDDQCRWAAWFRSNFKHEKVESSDGNLTKWKAEHAAMVDARVGSLIADGWTVFLEAQNKFTLPGKAATLAGVADIVAVRDDQALIVDCKSGKPRDKDYWQVCIYLMVLPLVHPALRGSDRRLVGEVEYRDHSVTIQPEEFTLAMRERISAQIRESGGSTPPVRVPSFRECRFCSIGKQDCPDRIEKQATAEAVGHGLF